jgi:hypothetical protein
MAQSALDKIKQLRAEEAKLISEARREALAKAEEAIKELNDLGFHFRLVEGQTRAGADGPRKGTRQVDPMRPCPICGFRTDPPHDARRHRSQGEDKRPFTDEELRQLGLEKVS